MAHDHESEEEIVIYKSAITNVTWARSMKNFTETVIRDGKEISRFTYIADPEKYFSELSD